METDKPELPHWTESPGRIRGGDGVEFLIGDRVKVVGQDIHGEIVRWDGGKAVVLDDDRDEWRFDIEPEGEEGTLIYSLRELVKW